MKKIIKVELELEFEVTADDYPEAQEFLRTAKLSSPEMASKIARLVESNIRWEPNETIAYDETGNHPIYLGEMVDRWCDGITQKN